jgi:hypothetical protein
MPLFYPAKYKVIDLISSSVKDSPLIVRPLVDGDIEILGSVHSLQRNVPLILREIERFSPDFIAIELTVPDRLIGSQDVDAVSVRYGDRLVCLDRTPEITTLRYLSDTPPPQYMKERSPNTSGCRSTRPRYLPTTTCTGCTALFGNAFYTFGWSREDERRFISSGTNTWQEAHRAYANEKEIGVQGPVMSSPWPPPCGGDGCHPRIYAVTGTQAATMPAEESMTCSACTRWKSRIR